MKIVLLRHGKPEVPELGKLRANEFYRWIEAYNLAVLDKRHKPSAEVMEMANHCDIIVCSDLRRSIESAKALGVKDIHCIDALFREFELPYAKFPSPKLSPGVWSVAYRILWFMGYASNSESLYSARERAASAANILHTKALRNKTVIFVGHSLLNSFIAKRLVSKGWQGTSSIFSQYWEYSVFDYLKS